MNLTRAALAIVLAGESRQRDSYDRCAHPYAKLRAKRTWTFREQLHEHFRENMLQDQDLVERNCAELRAWPKWKTRGMWIRPRSTSAGVT
jgi:hypothetical protein